MSSLSGIRGPDATDSLKKEKYRDTDIYTDKTHVSDPSSIAT